MAPTSWRRRISGKQAPPFAYPHYPVVIRIEARRPTVPAVPAPSADSESFGTIVPPTSARARPPAAWTTSPVPYIEIEGSENNVIIGGNNASAGSRMAVVGPVQFAEPCGNITAQVTGCYNAVAIGGLKTARTSRVVVNWRAT